MGGRVDDTAAQGKGTDDTDRHTHTQTHTQTDIHTLAEGEERADDGLSQAREQDKEIKRAI